jgi:hypothetical protein
MTQLTKDERQALEALGAGALDQPQLSKAEQWVLPTPRARLNYILFATEASRFYKGRQAIGFRGDNWLL